MKTKQEWKICDCLVGLPEIPDKSVDMILTDLPYGATPLSWDIQIQIAPLIQQYKRILKEHGVIVLTASQPFASHLIVNNSRRCKKW